MTKSDWFQIYFIEKEIPFPQYQERSQNEQNSGLYHLAHRMRRKNLVEETCRDMEDDRHQNVPAGFIVQPVHQQNEGNETETKIQRV